MDFAIAWNATTAEGDLLMSGPDLAADSGLRTAVAVSLLTDRTAEETDSPGEPWDGDRRGWWGDMPIGDGDTRGPVGSRLWLLRRAPRTTETLRDAEAFAEEALRWLVQDGIAERVVASAAWYGEARDQLGLTAEVIRGREATRFDFAWDFR